MKIKIAQRLAPFSHTPGSACVIPGTCSILQAFPTLIRIDENEIQLNLTGPVKDFTLQQDLERHCVFVFGKATEGYFRLKITGSDSGFEINVEKGPLKSVKIEREVFFVPAKSVERLSLGSHKAQDWDLVQNLKTSLPVLFSLGQQLPLIPPQPLTGTARLLEFPEDKTQLAEAIASFFSAAFSQIFVPRLIDDQYQGLAPVEPVTGSRFFLIQEGMRRLRALFFRQNERRLSFLPQLASEFDAGRLIGIQAPGIGEIDFEWSKKLLRRVIIRANTSGEAVIVLQNQLKSFRVGKKKFQKSSEPLLLEAGKITILDRFQK